MCFGIFSFVSGLLPLIISTFKGICYRNIKVNIRVYFFIVMSIKVKLIFNYINGKLQVFYFFLPIRKTVTTFVEKIHL